MCTQMRKQKKMAAPIRVGDNYGNLNLILLLSQLIFIQSANILYIHDQWASAILINATQLVHFGQVLGKLNFSPVAPSPAAYTQC